MSYKHISLEFTEDDYAIITLKSPQTRNSLHSEMLNELTDSVNVVASHRETGALVLTGEGKAFCSGGDLREMEKGLEPLEGYLVVKKFYPFLLRLTNLEIPVIAAVNGYAVGAGFNIALACDIIYASEEAIFSQGFVLVGLTPDMGGTYYLPRIIGLPRAKELIFTGKQISAAEAFSMGLVNKVLPPDKLMKEALNLAASLARGPRVALKLAKQMLNSSYNLSLEEALEYEAFAQGLCFQTADHKEGARAFLEKRKPKFKGY